MWWSRVPDKRQWCMVCSTTVHVSVLSFNDLSTYLIYIPFQYVVSFVTLLNCNILVEGIKLYQPKKTSKWEDIKSQTRCTYEPRRLQNCPI